MTEKPINNKIYPAKMVSYGVHEYNGVPTCQCYDVGVFKTSKGTLRLTDESYSKFKSERFRTCLPYYNIRTKNTIAFNFEGECLSYTRPKKYKDGYGDHRIYSLIDLDYSVFEERCFNV